MALAPRAKGPELGGHFNKRAFYYQEICIMYNSMFSETNTGRGSNGFLVDISRIFFEESRDSGGKRIELRSHFSFRFYACFRRK